VKAKLSCETSTTMRSADTVLRNTIELRATASEIAAPQPDLDAKAKIKGPDNPKLNVNFGEV